MYITFSGNDGSGKSFLIKEINKKGLFMVIRKFASYTNKSSSKQNLSQRISVIGRYKMFFSQPQKLFRNFWVGIGMLFMKSCEFGFGGVGYGIGKILKK